MGKVALKHELSLKAKFKSETVVEITVVDHTTKETFITLYDFRAMKKEQVESQPEQGAAAESLVGAADDKDSN